MVKKIKKIGIDFNPLNVSTSLVVRGGGLTQKHCAETGEYIPDREITPLLLIPKIWVDDPHKIIPSGVVNLGSFSWYAIPNSLESTGKDYLRAELSKYLVTSQTRGYEVRSDGSLVVTKNVPYMSPEVLVFTGCFTDPRNGHIIRVQASLTMSSTSVAVSPSLELDRPGSWTYNPINETARYRTIRAKLRLGGIVPDPKKCRTAFWWYRVDGKNENILNEDELAYEGGQGSDTLTIDPSYIDDTLHLRCRAEFAFGDAPLPKQPSGESVFQDTLILRRYPAYDFDHFVHGGVEVTPSAKFVHNECVVTAGRQVVEHPSRWFKIRWSIRSQTFGAEWRDLGGGETIDIPATEFCNGSDVGLEVEPKQAKGAAVYGEDILTHKGNILVL